MRYLCLVYGAEDSLPVIQNPNPLSRVEADALTQDSLAYNDMLRTSGHFIVAHALQSARTATTVRVRGGRVLVTDGPFAETKEQLLGFVLIEAKDHDDAVEVASRIPLARLGSVEVRPIMDLVRKASHSLASASDRQHALAVAISAMSGWPISTSVAGFAEVCRRQSRLDLLAASIAARAPSRTSHRAGDRKGRDNSIRLHDADDHLCAVDVACSQPHHLAGA
jgi:hypothetical protein